MRNTITLPNLTGLSRQDASDLEQVVIAGIIYLGNKAGSARDNLRKAGEGRWADGHREDLAAAERLIAAGRRFESASHNQARQEGIRECVAARVIHAFAIEAMREPKAAEPQAMQVAA